MARTNRSAHRNLRALARFTVLLSASIAAAQPGGVRGEADRAFEEVERESKRAAAERVAPVPTAPKAPATRPASKVVGIAAKDRPTPRAPASVAAAPASVAAAPASVAAAPASAAPAAPASTPPAVAQTAAIGPNDPRMDLPVNLARPDNAVMDAAIGYATNAERVRHGLKPLNLHASLAQAAATHAERMARLNFFSHQDPHEAARKAPGDRAKLAGIKKPFIAENIAQSHATAGGGRTLSHRALAQGIVTQWMNSPGHRANILSASGLQMGAGVAGHPNGQQVMAAQMFQWFEPAP
jgi:uncharacterized protein YkwD